MRCLLVLLLALLAAGCSITGGVVASGRVHDELQEVVSARRLANGALEVDVRARLAGEAEAGEYRIRVPAESFDAYRRRARDVSTDGTVAGVRSATIELPRSALARTGAARRSPAATHGQSILVRAIPAEGLDPAAGARGFELAPGAEETLYFYGSASGERRPEFLCLLLASRALAPPQRDVVVLRIADPRARFPATFPLAVAADVVLAPGVALRDAFDSAR